MQEVQHAFDFSCLQYTGLQQLCLGFKQSYNFVYLINSDSVLGRPCYLLLNRFDIARERVDEVWFDAWHRGRLANCI